MILQKENSKKLKRNVIAFKEMQCLIILRAGKHCIYNLKLEINFNISLICSEALRRND
jgi:hypothetical protein